MPPDRRAAGGDGSHRSGPAALRRRAAAVAVLALVALTVVGAVLRVIVAHQSLFADELSTYWISATHGLGGVLSLLYGAGRIQHAEITPPLSFLRLVADHQARAHARAAAAAVADRRAPRRSRSCTCSGCARSAAAAALLAAALTTLSPFMIYYSAEARAYGLMMFWSSRRAAVDAARPRHGARAAGGFCTRSARARRSTRTTRACSSSPRSSSWVLWAQPAARRRR